MQVEHMQLLINECGEYERRMEEMHMREQNAYQQLDVAADDYDRSVGIFQGRIDNNLMQTRLLVAENEELKREIARLRAYNLQRLMQQGEAAAHQITQQGSESARDAE